MPHILFILQSQALVLSHQIKPHPDILLHGPSHVTDESCFQASIPPLPFQSPRFNYHFDVATRCQHLTTANAARQRLFSPRHGSFLTQLRLYCIPRVRTSQQLCVLHTALFCCRKWRTGNANLVNYERSRKRGSVTRRKTGRFFAKITSVHLEKPS